MSWGRSAARYGSRIRIGTRPGSSTRTIRVERVPDTMVLSVVWIDRHFPGAGPAVPLSRAERPIYVGLLASLVFSAAVALGGLSGAGAQPVAVTALGVLFAAGAASRSP
jgi:hypothetical protein